MNIQIDRQMDIQLDQREKREREICCFVETCKSLFSKQPFNYQTVTFSTCVYSDSLENCGKFYRIQSKKFLQADIRVHRKVTLQRIFANAGAKEWRNSFPSRNATHPKHDNFETCFGIKRVIIYRGLFAIMKLVRRILRLLE